jgi:hypothetical protein
MTAFACSACGRDLRLIVHKVDEDGRRWCLAFKPTSDEADGPDDTAAICASSTQPSGYRVAQAGIMCVDALGLGERLAEDGDGHRL